MIKKGNIFFNIIIIISIIAFICVFAYMLYYHISNYIELKQAEKEVDLFEQQVSQNDIITVDVNDVTNEENVVTNPQSNPVQTTNKKRVTVKHKGYTVIGTIQIPKTKVKSPIVDNVTPSSISAAVATLYGPGLNKVGNTVLVAHNYRNGTFFSNNKKLVVGDKIYITDTTGVKQEYTITKTYTTSAEDFAYATRNTNGKKEISLSTCTTDVNKRLVIWAVES